MAILAQTEVKDILFMLVMMAMAILGMIDEVKTTIADATNFPLLEGKDTFRNDRHNGIQTVSPIQSP